MCVHAWMRGGTEDISGLIQPLVIVCACTWIIATAVESIRGTPEITHMCTHPH